MTHVSPNSRIIGLDLHPHRFGYAVMELAENVKLFDCGVSRVKTAKDASKTLSTRHLRRLLETWKPSFVKRKFKIVVEDLPVRRSRRVGRFTQMVKQEARRSRISLCTVKPESVANALGMGRNFTKTERASILAERFPLLRWKLPPRRSPGASEDYRMSMFDAAALALGYAAKRTQGLAGKRCLRGTKRLLVPV